LTELGMIDNPGYKVCFVLDKTRYLLRLNTLVD
jgi:hypothetical protein